MNHLTDQIETYLADGLSPDERAAFEAHIAECAACSAALDNAKSADDAMSELFAKARPSEGFEERVIASLRKRESWLTRRIVHPMVRRVAVGLAASMVLGTVGYVADRATRAGRPKHAFSQTKRMSDRERAESVATDRMPQWQGYASSSNPNNTHDFKYRNVDSAYLAGMGRRLDSPDHAWMASRYPTAASGAENSKTRGYEYWGAYESNSSTTSSVPAPPAAPIDKSNPVFIPDSTTFATGLTTNGTTSQAATPRDRDQQVYFALNALNDYRVTAGRDTAAGGTSGKAVDGPRLSPAPTTPALATKSEAEKHAQIAQLNSDKTQLQTSLTSANAALQVAHADMKARSGAAETPKTGTYPIDIGLAELPIGNREARNIAARANVEDASGNLQVAKVLTDEPHPPAKAAEPKPQDVPAPKLPAPDNAPKPQTAVAETPRPAPVIKPKIIRTGEMEFEVDGFDSSVLTITKIVAEEGGYVSTTNSDKLPNGKVKGSIVLRVVPERLDTLVLKLRGIGDLKTQRIAAVDITKQYTDLSSALRAAQAMQERLLDIIKNGKGTVKDLLEAERQLGVWREKVEQLEGEIRYYDSQVALSTLTLTLFERDIRMAAVASESETVTMSLETEKVEDAYAKAKDAVTQSKGRIINSSLKQFDAGQYGATLSAAVPPDAADAFIGRLKQIEGRVARFDRARSQTTSNGNNPVDPRSTDAVKVKREDVVINLTLYNLANIAPRRWTNLTLVASSVDETYRTLLEQVKSAGGRIVESQINHPRPDQTTGSIKLDIPSEKADAVLLALRGMGEVLQVNTTENASTQDVTESKRGFVLTIGSLSAFKPRETQQVQLAATNVPAAFADLLETIRVGKGRILTSHLDEQDSRNAVGTLEFELGREAQPALEQAMNKDGQIVSRLADHSMDTDNTVDSKVHIKLTVGSSEQLPPRQMTDLSVEVSDVQKAMDDLQAAVLSAGGRQIDNPAISQGDGSQTTARVSFDVPLDKIPTLVTTADEMGTRKSRQTSIDARAPEGKLARARLTVTFATPAALAGSDDSIWAGIRRGLGTSLRWLSTSFTLIVVGLCVVLPWVVLAWGGWRGVRWMRKPAVANPKSE